jgi:response regulator RpfG family c-di-GMP phosphodiesterase
MMSDRPILLIVDDEERILSALRRSLRREGYTILTAQTPSEVIKLLDEYPVDIVLTDHKMPGTSGLEVLAEAAKRRPKAARMMITGWPESVSRERLDKLGVCALLPKPWDDVELKAALRAAAP